MVANAVVLLPLLAVGLASATTTCQEACFTEKPECKNGMFPLQSVSSGCWSCCFSDEKACLQVCFSEPPTCADGMAATKRGECYTCCRAPLLPTESEVEPFPLPTVIPRTSEVCDRQCSDEPPTCGEWVPFQPGGGSCWACCDPSSLPSNDSEIPDGPEPEPTSLTPTNCDRSCFDEPPECGEGMIPWSDNDVCWSCCDDPSLE